MQIVSLDSYNIHVGTDIWDAFTELVKSKDYSKVCVLVDTNTKRDCLPVFIENTGLEDIHVIEIPFGELHKNIGTCQEIWKSMFDAECNRRSLLVNLGGGVIGDMGGFCASTFKRGIDFIQFPTTLLSQVDASIGGKLGIDFNEVKNSIGAFNNPQGVFINPVFYNTLPKRELASGFAEIIKHSLIYDKSQWSAISSVEDTSTEDWTKHLVPSLTVKKDIVTQDPFERGIRKALNFGHTIGHAVESVSLTTSKPLLHGEAIGVGMICEAYLSVEQIGLDKSVLKEIEKLVFAVYKKYDISSYSVEDMMALMKQDKKNERDEINFTFISALGKCEVNQEALPSDIIKSLEYYQSL